MPPEPAVRTLYAMPSRSQHRGASAELTAEAIVDAAEAIATSESWDALSMRRVARALGRAPMSLYRHVRDVDQLRVLVAERLIERVAVVDHGPDWRRTLTDAATSMRRTLVAHPALLQQVMRSGMATPGMLHRIDVIMGALATAGLSIEQVARSHASLMALVFGSAVLQRAALESLPAADGPPGRHFIEHLAAAGDGAYPNVAAVAGAWAAMEEDEPFRFALERLLDGIAALGAN